jgi:hypothetical protein
MAARRAIRFPNFRTPRRYWHRVDGVTPPEPGSGRRQWVLSRALCLYARFPVPKDLAAAKREAALRLKILEWSPYPSPGLLIDWAEADAGVWVWDSQKVADAIRAEGQDPKRVTVLPETALAEPGTEGARIVSGLEGLDGQAWRQGRLIASRWWADLPSAEEWRRFQRAAALAPGRQSAEPPEPEPAAWRQDPWVSSRRPWLALVNEAGRTRLALASAIVLVLPIVYEGAALAHLKLRASAAETTLAQLRQRAEPVLRTRSAAQAAIDCVRALLQLDPYPDQLALLAKVGGQLPPNGTALGDWSYQNGELRFTLTHQNPLDSSFYVRLFEALQIFERVRAEPQGDGRTLVIQAKVRPQWS